MIKWFLCWCRNEHNTIGIGNGHVVIAYDYKHAFMNGCILCSHVYFWRVCLKRPFQNVAPRGFIFFNRDWTMACYYKLHFTRDIISLILFTRRTYTGVDCSIMLRVQTRTPPPLRIKCSDYDFLDIYPIRFGSKHGKVLAYSSDSNRAPPPSLNFREISPSPQAYSHPPSIEFYGIEIKKTQLHIESKVNKCSLHYSKSPLLRTPL